MCVMKLSIIVMIVSALLARALLNRRHCTNMSSVDVEMIDVHCMLATENFRRCTYEGTISLHVPYARVDGNEID